MEIAQLRAFVHIAETGSFTEAARRLHLTQPALSRQIRLLEESMGDRLLLRTGRGAVPTAAGEVLLDRARTILDEVERAHRDIAARQQAVTGRVALGLPPSVGVRLTAPLVACFRAAYPQVGLTIVEELTGVVQDGLLTGTLDLGLLYAGAASPSLRVEPLVAEIIHILAAPALGVVTPPAIPFHALSGVPLILPGRRHGLRAVLEQAAFRHGVTLRVDVEADSLRVISELTRHGLAPTLHAASAFDAELAAGSLVAAPVVPEIPRGIVLAWPRDRRLGRAAQAMAEMIRDQTRRLWREAAPVDRHPYP